MINELRQILNEEFHSSAGLDDNTKSKLVYWCKERVRLFNLVLRDANKILNDKKLGESIKTMGYNSGLNELKNTKKAITLIEKEIKLLEKVISDNQ